MKVLKAAALPGYDPEIGHWLWALEEVRGRTVQVVGDLDQNALDWQGPSGVENAIGSLLYHIALVEMSWLFMDILLSEIPPDIKRYFPYDMATSGRITPVLGVGLEDHLERLQRSRRVLLEAFEGMSVKDWQTLRDPGDVDYQVSPAWAVFHLLEHESGHTAQVSAMKARIGRDRARGE